LEQACIGLDWIGLDWIGLDWIGLDWIGLDWIAEHVVIVLGDSQAKIDLSTFDVHVIACILLTWLQELPEPLFGFDFYDKLIASLGAKDEPATLVGNMQQWVGDLAKTCPSAAITAKVLPMLCRLPSSTSDASLCGLFRNHTLLQSSICFHSGCR
jgi:hypothetical protein